MKKQIEIIIPLLKNEMEQVDNLSKPIIKVIINSTVKATLEQTNKDPDCVDTVITRFLVREGNE